MSAERMRALLASIAAWRPVREGVIPVASRLRSSISRGSERPLQRSSPSDARVGSMRERRQRGAPLLRPLLLPVCLAVAGGALGTAVVSAEPVEPDHNNHVGGPVDNVDLQPGDPEPQAISHGLSLGNHPSGESWVSVVDQVHESGQYGRTRADTYAIVAANPLVTDNGGYGNDGWVHIVENSTPSKGVCDGSLCVSIE